MLMLEIKMSRNKDKAIADYLKSRANKGDDRCSSDKRWKDAGLRGKLGMGTANKIINHIDELKSWR